MADSLVPIPNLALDGAEADAAAEALVRFSQSAQDLLRYRQIYAEGAQSTKALAQREVELRVKDDKIKELNMVIKMFTYRGCKEVLRMESKKNRAERERSELEAQLRQERKEKEDLKAQLEKTVCWLNERTDNVAQLQKEMAGFKARERDWEAAVRKEIAAKEHLTNQLHKTKIELEGYIDYTAGLVDVDMRGFSQSMQKVWKRAEDFVQKYFSVDIIPELLKEHDRWTQQISNFLQPLSGSVCIPPSNTPAAKFARKAAMLNVFAFMVAQWIFTDTQPLLAHVGLDAMLLKLTQQDERKETLCRAILNSVPCTGLSGHEELQQLTRWILETLGAILPSEYHTDMATDINNLISEASNSGEIIRRSRQKFMVTLDPESYPDAWTNYAAPGPQRRRNTGSTEASDIEDDDEVAFVTFPAIIAIGSSTFETVHHGILIRNSHLRQTTEEWRKQARRRRFSRTPVPINVASLPTALTNPVARK